MQIFASEFLVSIDCRKFGDIEGCTVIGEVSLRGRRFPGPLRIQHVTFAGDVDLADVIIDGELNLKGCTFAKTLTLARAKITGSVVLDDVVLVDAVPFESRSISLVSPFDLQGITIGGDLRLTRAELQSEVFGQDLKVRIVGAELEGSMLLDGLECGMPVDMSGTRIGRNLSIRADTLTGGRFALLDGGIIGINLDVRGNIDFRGGKFSHVVLTNSSIGGNISVQPMAVAETIFHNYFWSLDLSFSKISGFISLVGSNILGSLNLRASEMQTLYCVPYIRRAEDQSTSIHRCHFGTIMAAYATVRTWASLISVSVDGRGMQTGKLVIEMIGFKSGGDLSFFASSAFDFEGRQVQNLPTAHEDGSTALGDVSLARSQIGGTLILTNIQVQGTIDLDGAQVDAGINFGTLDSALEDPANAAFLAGRNVGQFRGAIACRLRMTSLICGDDVDLTGLKIIDPILEEDRSKLHGPPTDGAISGRDITVKGELRLFRCGRTNSDTFTWIDHSLDLSNSNIHHLILSSYSFDKKSSGPADVPLIGINLTNATIHELEVPAIRSVGPNAPSEIFPVPIDLGDSSISIWNIKDEELNDAQCFPRLLAQDKQFRRSTYLAVEKYFRNRGQERDANAIYQAMSIRAHRDTWRELRKKPGKWRKSYFWLWTTPWHHMFRITLGFGTEPMRLGWAIIFLWLISLPVYMNVANIQPTYAERADRAAHLRLEEGAGARSAGDMDANYQRVRSDRVKAELTRGPSNQDWSFWDAVAISLRHNVPLMGIAVRSSWELRDTPSICYTSIESLWAGDCRGIVIPDRSPEDWGILMSTLNIIMWPLLLTFGIRKLLRQS